jgi:hypothetical protein
VAVALRGDLRDFGIADVFQLIGQQRKTGVLEFEDGTRRVQLHFDRGAVVSAAPVRERGESALLDALARCGLLLPEQVEDLTRECRASGQTETGLAVARGWIAQHEIDEVEDLLTRDTFFDLLRWESGAFDFRAQPVEHARAVEALLGAEQILMDGLRMVDEWHSFADLVPSEQMVFARAARHDELLAARGSFARPDAVERVFERVDGQLPVRRVVDLSRLGTFDAVRALADLRQAGLIAPLEASAVRRPRRERPRRRLSLRGAVAGLVPLLLLALAAAEAVRPEPAPAPPSSHAIARSALEAARRDFAARGVRRGLEAYRYADGRWPRALGDLEERGVLPPGALTAGSGDPYYYSVRDGGAVLLAPER